MSFFDTQNPGIGGLKELTSAELALVQALAALGDPNADKILGWDDTDNTYSYFTIGTGLTYTHATHTLSSSGGLSGSGVANEIAYFTGASALGSLATATYPSLTELAYVKGVTSSIQTQLGNKQPLDTQLTDLAGLSYTGNALKYIRVNAGENGWEVATVSGSGATTALDNLASVSINTSLLAQTGVDLGSTTKPFRNLFLWGSGTYATTYIELTGTPTSTRVLTLPDVTDTLVGKTTTDILTNKTLTAPVINTGTIGTSLVPTSNDGAALGDTTHNFSDLFLATGALINIANSNWVATHSSGILTVSTGELRITSANVGTNADSVPTLSSTSTFTNKTLTSPTLTTPVINGTITGTGQSTTATVSTIVMRDSSGNAAVVNMLEGYTTTATAAGTTTLTVASNNMQYFTGVTTQTVQLPVASTLVLGTSYWITNLSTGLVTINSSGGNAILILAAGTSAEVTCILTSGTSAASWNYMYMGDIVATGKKLTVSNSITLTGTDATVMTFPTTTATIARTDAGQTFTGVNTMTAPVMVTSIDTSSTSFTAFAGATTLLTIGGTGASASLFAPSTLDTSSSTTGAIRTSGGISAAKSANIGTTLTVGTGYQIGGAAASNKILKGNGTNFVASTETYAAPGTSGNVMTSDGTNWTSAAAGGGGFPVQDVPYSTSTTVPQGANSAQGVAFTSTTNGSACFLAWSTGGVINIERFEKDTGTSNYFKTHTTTFSIGNSGNMHLGLAVFSTNLYLFLKDGATIKCIRYVHADLTGVQAMTYSGTSQAGPAWADASAIYVYDQGGSGGFSKFTVSGTTITNTTTTISLTSQTTPWACISDGTSVWATSDEYAGAVTFRKYPIAGGASTGSKAMIIQSGAYFQAFSAGLYMASATTLGISWGFFHSTPTTVSGQSVHLLAITTP